MWGAIYQFFKRIKNLLILGIYLCFVLSMLAQIVSPSLSVFFAPFGLLFLPLLLLTLTIGVIYFRRNKWIAISAIILVAFSFKFLGNSIALNFNQEKKGLKVMSWNVKNFDLYNWTKNQETRQKMLTLIDSQDADVLCFQEFYNNPNSYNNIDALKKLGYQYISFFPTFSQKDGDQWGLAILSKYQLSNSKAITLSKKSSSLNHCVRADLTFENKKYTIFNAHMQSIHLDYTDLNYIEDVKKEISLIDKIKSWHILRKILGAYTHRQEQVGILAEELKASENVILCCDLNDIPASYAYQQLSKECNDAFKEKGFGLSHTISIGLPLYRIDYIFISPSIITNSYQRIETELSDHHMVISYLQ